MSRFKTHVSYNAGSRRTAEEITAQIICNTFNAPQRSVIIAVGGPGGTGKSTFCSKLANIIADSCILHLDDYKTPRMVRKKSNLFGAHPKANRMDLIREHILASRAGYVFDKPVYDAVSGDAETVYSFTPKRYVILDGEISTYDQFRDLVDFSIFIDSDWRTQLATRCSRDIEMRGYSREKAISTFLQSNLREFQEFGAQSKKWADMHLYCREDYHLIVESMTEELFERFGSLLAEDFSTVDLSGLIVPVTVPFDAGDRVDEKMFIAHLNFLADHHIHRILINGTTGEFFSLTHKERKLLLTVARQYFPGVIFFQAGSNVISASLELARVGVDYGADAVVCLPPFYFAHAPQRGIIEYLNAIAETVDVPFIVYNFPLHTQNGLTSDMLKEIRHFGMKDSSADLNLISATSHYYIGGDKFISGAYAHGAYGFVSGHANHTPWLYSRMEKALREKAPEQIADYQSRISTISEFFSGQNQIALIKYAVGKRIRGYSSAVRPPLFFPVHDKAAEIGTFINQEWKR